MTALLPSADNDAMDHVHMETQQQNNDNTITPRNSLPDWVTPEEWGEALAVPEWEQEQQRDNGKEYRRKHGWKGRDLIHDVDAPVRIISYHVQYGPGEEKQQPDGSQESSYDSNTAPGRGGVGTTLRGVVHFTNRAESHAGYCHGGSMTSVMDDVIGWTAFLVTGSCRPWTGFTVQVNCSLQKPIPVDSYLLVEGKITKVERRKVSVEVSLIDPTEKGRNVVHATGTGLVVMNRGELPITDSQETTITEPAKPTTEPKAVGVKKTTISLALLDVSKAVANDPNGQQLLLTLNDEDCVFLHNSCKAESYLNLKFPTKQETATTHHQITKFLQTKDKYTAAASMLLKSQAFLSVHQHNSFLRPTQLIDLPRTKHKKPYIPLSQDALQAYQLRPDVTREDKFFPLSISHQFPLVGMARTTNTEPGADAPLVGLDIVIFDPINTKLYKSEQEFLDVFHESFTQTEWRSIMMSTSKMEELYVRWAMKEAYTKARGLGMGIEFNSFEISLDNLETSEHQSKMPKTLSLWKYILEQQRKAETNGGNIFEKGFNPDPLQITATICFLTPSALSCKNERNSFFFLPLENGQAKGCACVCVGPLKDSAGGVALEVGWTSLNELMEWHGGKQQSNKFI